MGLADREYQRRDVGGDGFLSRLTPVVRWLLLSNVGIFFFDMFFGHKFLQFGAFAIQSAIFEYRIWEFLTFQFLHGSLGHLLFNSIGLYFFGPWMERWWGSKKFLLFYLLCGCAGAAFFTLLMLLGLLPGSTQTGLIGASAGIYGIFIGVAVIAPSLRVALLFPPIELSMRQLAIALLVISSGAIILNWGGNEGGEAGHLGGAILGFILVRHPQLLGFAAPRPQQPRRTYESKLRPRSNALREQDSAVDLILDKISREGFQSLTAEERNLLQKASQGKNSDS
jgi:membrane associated rhomboid family serine protease